MPEDHANWWAPRLAADGGDNSSVIASQRVARMRSRDRLREASRVVCVALDCFASLAMTDKKGRDRSRCGPSFRMRLLRRRPGIHTRRWCYGFRLGLRAGMTRKKRPGSLPAFVFSLSPSSPASATIDRARRTGSSGQAGDDDSRVSLRLGALRRGGRPLLDQRVVVTVSPFGFSLASLRCGAMLPSFSDLANQYSVFLLVQLRAAAPCTPAFSSRSHHRSCAAAASSIAACGVFAPDDASPMFCPPQLRKFGYPNRCCRSGSTARRAGER